jgi:putative N6-adenine-specific DNA methylase
MPLQIVATCPAGIEEILAGELRELGVEAPRTEQGAAIFDGGWRDVWRANWRLRTANRVLVELARWPVTSAVDLSAGAEALVTGERAWEDVSAKELFDPRRTLALRATVARSPIRDTRWVALKVKDGLVDGQRRRFGKRSSVRREQPDLPLRVRLLGEAASLLLDTSGEPLDRRGYRVEGGPAPLREQLAAACVLAAAWDGRGPVVDPMCGSGTLLAEAGAFALGLPPGRLRPRWAFEGLPGFDAEAWKEVRRERLPRPASRVSLIGIDRSPRQVAAARANLERAGLAKYARVSVGDAFDSSPPPGPGLVVVNPAFGERIAGEPDQWPRLGDLLKQRYTGWRAVVLAGGADRGKGIGLRPRRRIPVRAGPIETRILVLDLYRGSLQKP